MGRERGGEEETGVMYPTGRTPLPGDTAMEDATTLPSAERRSDAAAGPPPLSLETTRSMRAATPATAADATDGEIVDGFVVSVARVPATTPVASALRGVVEEDRAPSAATMPVASAVFVDAIAARSDTDGPPTEALAAVTAVSTAELAAADARRAAVALPLAEMPLEPPTVLLLATEDANTSVAFRDAPGASGGVRMTLDHTTPRDPRESMHVAARSTRVGTVGRVAPVERVDVCLNDGTEVVSVPLPRETPGGGAVEKDDCIDRRAA